MDEQTNDRSEPLDERPPDDAQLQPGETESSEGETPDAVKAQGAESKSRTDEPQADNLGAGDVKDPSMDFANAAAGTEPFGAVSETGVIGDAPHAHPAEFPQFGQGMQGKIPRNIDLLMDVQLPVSIELGRATLPISEILEWSQGSVIELDRLAGEPVDLMVNHKLVAKGEVVVVDEKFGLRITSLISPRERLESL